MLFQWIDPQILPLLMQYGTDLVKALLGAIIAFQYARVRRLKDMLERAQRDIAYLLRVEALHCDLHREALEESFKLRVRRSVDAEGMDWSGLFTPGRIRYRTFRSQFGRLAIFRYFVRSEKGVPLNE